MTTAANPALRDEILRSKRAEIAHSVSSRKRKLRELYTVARYDVTETPQVTGLANPTPAENAFLEANDILKGRFFDESTLPSRAPFHEQIASTQLLPDEDQKQPSQTASPSSVANDGARQPVSRAVDGAQDQVVSADALSRPHPLPSPPDGTASQGDANVQVAEDHGVAEPQKRARTLQPSLTMQKATATLRESQPSPAPQDEAELDRTLEKERIKQQVESPPGSPGVDPAKAVPISPDDAQSLPASTVHAASPDGERLGPRTVHLPPKRTQERHLREVELGQERDLQRQRKEEEKHRPSSAGLPTISEPLSSPTSTVGPYSTNTPAMNIVSPDTSPEHDGAGEAAAPPLRESTPDALKPSAQEQAAKAEHDKLLKSQMKLARRDAFESGPSTAEAQLKLEEQQAAAAASASQPNVSILPDSVPTTENAVGPAGNPPLTQKADEIVQDIVDDEDEVVGVPTAGEEMEIADETGQPEIDGLSKEDKATTPIPHAASAQSTPMDMDGIEATAAIMAQKGTAIDAKLRPNDDHSRTAQPVAKPPTDGLHPPHTQAPSAPDRMTTRVSSGAIRHKSVSEILGEVPKPHLAAINEKQSPEPVRANSALMASPSASRGGTPASAAVRLRNNERKERERSKLSTVVFARPSQPRSESLAPARKDQQVTLQDEKDYLRTLFAAQASSAPRSQSLNSILTSAHKTLTTSNHYVDFFEQQDCRILKRIYHLQYANRWSLRQLTRAAEAPRPVTHWDALLDEMKWMQTDFREERKWKLTMAKHLADWCAEWHACSPEDRLALQVKRRVPKPIEDVDMKDAPSESQPDGVKDIKHDDQQTPDLVPSAEDDSMSDAPDFEEHHRIPFEIVAPAAIFALPPDEATFDLQKTSASVELLNELPLYEPVKDIPRSEFERTTIIPDAAWKLPMVPVSKFVQGKMIGQDEGPPRKRSRYDYESEDEELDADSGLPSNHRRRFQLPPEQRDVALFTPENKHIRDRLHAGHAFRPPSEFPMPSQTFFETRNSSQWTYSEDDELRKLVREYSYNWSLIASCLSSSSLFSSGAERRTPWECFERWVGLEGLPADMSKTQYFRAYHARLEGAQRTLSSQQQAAQQQQQNNNPSQSVTPVRRKITQPVRVERRKNTKHFALIDAMRKLAKKREAALQKQQQAAGLAAMRKANEITHARPSTHTPQDFSRLKYERECKMQEKAEAYRQQMLAHQRAALQQRPGQQPTAQQSLLNGAAPQARHATPGSANVNGVPGAPLPAAHVPQGVPAQPRAHPIPTMHNGLPNQAGAHIPPGMTPNPQLAAMKGMPQATMQPGLPGQQRMPAQMTPDNMRVLLEANRVQQEQQRYLQARQQQHFQASQQHHGQPGPAGSPNLANLNVANQSNPAVLAAMQAASNANGMRSPSHNNLHGPAGATNSPRLAQAYPSQPNQPQQLSSGMIPAVNSIAHQLKARHPQMSNEQIQKLASEQLAQQYQQRMAAQQQPALNANAAAAQPMSNDAQKQHNTPLPPQQHPLMGNHPTTAQQQQLYAQMLRAQQAGQSRASTVAPNGARPASRSATPATPQPQRSNSVQAPRQGQSQSPRPPQAQVAGGQ
ncbi:hypothetical protein L228DRAFT_245567 [Xylona heveae TC161]|uniref:Vacuolar import and degradation protein 21 n=1 Tax=Xylona heveae (strain CBS 132557 / TC161) TaxID=1328760 RepID=A0A161TF40_XYLHT|nr:hypothetical protein L228DRAFT_245567 [Xylona heveae TC161]KZF24597.1 hypothetical protein L228DRAFT_245567 [Xylona heveae TC161]